MSRLHFLPLILVLTILSGCGGGGTNTTPTTAETPVSVAISWPARTRAIDAPASALSCVVTLANLNPTGGNFTFEIDRGSQTAAFTQTYTSANQALVGATTATVNFYAAAGGAGPIVASASTPATLTGAGGGIGPIAVSDAIHSVVVTPNQVVSVGSTNQLTFTAYDASNKVVAVSPGSANWSVATGTTFLSLTPDGIASGAAVGSPSVVATVDGNASPATLVGVNAQSYVGSYKGNLNVASGPFAGQSFAVDLVVGADGKAGLGVDAADNAGPCLIGTADLQTGAVTLNQASVQLSGTMSASIQLTLTANGGTGTFTATGNEGASAGTFIIAVASPIASSAVGGYLGTVTFTSGPDSGASWPIQMFVSNDGIATGSTYDPEGDGFSYAGTMNFGTGALNLTVGSPRKSLAGITGTLSGSLASSKTISGTVTLSNGDTGAVTWPLVVP